MAGVAYARLETRADFRLTRYLEHDRAGLIESGFERTQNAAQARADQELAKWTTPRRNSP